MPSVIEGYRRLWTSLVRKGFCWGPFFGPPVSTEGVCDPHRRTEFKGTRWGFQIFLVAASCLQIKRILRFWGFYFSKAFLCAGHLTARLHHKPAGGVGTKSLMHALFAIGWCVLDGFKKPNRKIPTPWISPLLSPRWEVQRPGGKPVLYWINAIHSVDSKLPTLPSPSPTISNLIMLIPIQVAKHSELGMIDIQIHGIQLYTMRGCLFAVFALQSLFIRDAFVFVLRWVDSLCLGPPPLCSPQSVIHFNSQFPFLGVE